MSLRSDNEQLRAQNAQLLQTIEALNKTLQSLEKAFQKQTLTLEKLQKRLFSKSSEKMPPPEQALKKREKHKADPELTKKRRADNRKKRLEKVVEQASFHPVPDDERQCPKCGSDELQAVGKGRTTTLWEYIPGTFVRHAYLQESLRCRCGGIVCATLPQKPFEGGHYGPRFIAHLLVSKCMDALPLYRMEKRFERLGIKISRKTMCDQFHRAAEMLKPLSDRLLEQVRHSEVVMADETTIKIKQTNKRGYLWTFISEKLISYRFTSSKSGDLPKSLLEGTEGVLLADASASYNKVKTVSSRIRAGCLAHARRRFFDAKDEGPEAKEALELILDVYAVEREAKKQEIFGTEAHLSLRQDKSAKAMEKLHAWLAKQKGLHPPKSGLGQAISYSLKNWPALTVFLENAKVPVDNNQSENALRVAALGRKNFLFVGHEKAGENLAGLYSLMSTCQSHGVNPEVYLADVLLRVHTHPNRRLDELLPQNWQPLQ